jgi:GNAT superfamily N-acetyltransferase
MVDNRTSEVSLEDHELALLAERNLALALQVWAGAADGGGFAEEAAGCIAWCSTPKRSFNNVLPTGGGGLERLMERARNAFASHGRFRVRPREDVVAIDDDSASQLGLSRKGGIPSLVLADNAATVATLEDVLEVRDRAGLDALVHVVASSFGEDAAMFSPVFSEKLLSDDRWRGFVAYVDGAPAATSHIVVDDRGTAGIYYVGTVERYRGQGLGEGITAHAVVAGRKLGCVRSSLQASPMGQPIYERMGFRQVAYYRQYLPTA